MCSCDVRILFGVHIPMTYVSSGDVRIHVRILSTYVLYRRTCSTDVRVLSTYVFGTTLLEIEDSGLRSRNHGFGTTLDSEYAEYSVYWIWLKKIAVDLLGLRLAS